MTTAFPAYTDASTPRVCTVRLGLPAGLSDQITTVFDDLPQAGQSPVHDARGTVPGASFRAPLTWFTLSFQGGAKAVLANPTTCGEQRLTARLTPWSGGADAIARVVTAFPPGLAGGITGVGICPEAGVATGDCPADARVGSVAAKVGSGPEPVTLHG